MLRCRPVIVRYPCKTVLEDVLTRGKGTSVNDDVSFDNWTPFDGMEGIISEQFTGRAAERFNLPEFLEFCNNRDFDPSKVNRAENAGSSDTVYEKENAGFVTIDDVKNDKFLRDYIIQLMIGYKSDSKSPYRQYKGDNEIYLIPDNDDELTDEREFLISNEDDPLLDGTADALSQIPYLIKTIWNASLEHRVHLISFLIAYENIIKVERKSPSNIQPKDFSIYVTLMLNGNGGIKKEFNHEQDNKGEFYVYGRNWVTGMTADTQSYLAGRKLVALLEQMGYNMYDEDPYRYTDESISNMICTYIPTNDEYVQEFGEYDQELAVALQPGNLFRLRSELQYKNNEDIITVRDADMINSMVSYIEAMKEIDISVGEALSDDKTELLILYVRKLFEAYYEGMTIDTDTIEFNYANDILCFDGCYLKLPGQHISRCERKIVEETIFYRNGLILVFDREIGKTYYITVEQGLDFLEMRGASTYEGPEVWTCM